MDTNKDIQHQLDKINERLEIINRTYDFTSEQIEKEIEDQNKLNEVVQVFSSMFSTSK